MCYEVESVTPEYLREKYYEGIYLVAGDGDIRNISGILYFQPLAKERHLLTTDAFCWSYHFQDGQPKTDLYQFYCWYGDLRNVDISKPQEVGVEIIMPGEEVDDK